ncbi:FAD-dependent thymidylate synthase [Vampirovibrio chlorellavorus]|uniref:FAD-dependent thymidylate synthase n=1 Tax=Vampirovibrio chlorellavorus TaxID=758823 RepID=UPI0026F03CBA|nr:FAD-dependent thymidylate synthase [Vampirovibrio chlorellavorus]
MSPLAENDSPAVETEKHISVLDHGFVTLIDSMGSDLTVVNSARVSFGKRKTTLSEGDKKLIRYLAEHKHWSPFRHVQFQFHCKVPEFVARQWYKHVVGIAYTDAATVDHAWNEISLRYVDASEFHFYTPDGFRKQSEDNKQASTDDLVKDPDGLLMAEYQNHCQKALDLYHRLLEHGVAREQARGVLPLNIYTEFYWTVSLQALVNFIHLRTHAGAQYEIRLFADALHQLAQDVVPVSFEALMK